MAVWSQKWYIVVPLVLVVLGHWSLLLHGKAQNNASVTSLTVCRCSDQGFLGRGHSVMHYHRNQQQATCRYLHLLHGIRLLGSVSHRLQTLLPSNHPLALGQPHFQ